MMLRQDANCVTQVFHFQAVIDVAILVNLQRMDLINADASLCHVSLT
jgi:hypothetical protein